MLPGQMSHWQLSIVLMIPVKFGQIRLNNNSDMADIQFVRRLVSAVYVKWLLCQTQFGLC